MKNSIIIAAIILGIFGSAKASNNDNENTSSDKEATTNSNAVAAKEVVMINISSPTVDGLNYFILKNKIEDEDKFELVKERYADILNKKQDLYSYKIKKISELMDREEDKESANFFNLEKLKYYYSTILTDIEAEIKNYDLDKKRHYKEFKI